MKGQHEVLSAVLLTAVMIAIIGSVYLWGLPLIQKNTGAATLENSETLMELMADKIKYIANNGGRNEITITVPGIIYFYNDTGSVEFSINTDGTIYDTNALIPLIGDTCLLNQAVWGKDRPEVLCVESKDKGSNKFTTLYKLGFRELTSSNRNYKIVLQGPVASAGIDHRIIMENIGTEEVQNGNVLINTIIKISII